MFGMTGIASFLIAALSDDELPKTVLTQIIYLDEFATLFGRFAPEIITEC